MVAESRSTACLATVRDIVYAGSVVKLHLALADGTPIVALRSPSDPPFASGASVHIHWPAEPGRACRRLTVVAAHGTPATGMHADRPRAGEPAAADRPSWPARFP